MAANPTRRRVQSSSPFPRGYNRRSCQLRSGLLLSLLLSVSCLAPAADRWSELNIGSFYVDSRGETDAARDDLDQLEQLRWVLGNLLESKDLRSVWPMRVVLVKDKAGDNTKAHFSLVHGQYLLVCPAKTRLPLDEVAGILLRDNTAPMPPEAESGLEQLFGTLEAHGSRVSWGGAPPHPDLAWARMQLFATKFEYGLSFHIFVSALKNGSSIQVGEKNAFGRDPNTLEKEAAANLAAGHWTAASVNGRPLDPKRDLGEHLVDGAIVNVYLADGTPGTNARAAEAAYKAAIESGSAAMSLGYEGLAGLAEADKQDPRRHLEDAMRAESMSAPVYVAAAKNQPETRALELLKRAAQLNPRWGEPIFQQAQLAADDKEKEALLKKAVQLTPRSSSYWIELAQTQSKDGHALAAQASWLRAEDAASTDAERQRIHALGASSEQERLDAAEADRRREREATRLADQRAQDDEAARIHAAEEKANRRLDSSASGAKPSEVVPWEDTIPKKQLDGQLLQVDCLKGSARLTIRDKSGQTVLLLLKDQEASSLSCGPQHPARRVSVSYSADPDERFQTAGRVLSIQLR